jgi:putative transposase
MALLMPKILNLSDGERHELQKLIDKHKTPQQLVLRAKIILMASDGQNHREIARSLEINRQMARLWRNRWLESEGKDLSICEKLQDRERVGAPAKFSMEQVTELFARLLFLTVRLWTTNKSLDCERIGGGNHVSRHY